MLLINRFIKLIENHAETLSAKWVDAVRKSPLTAGYAKLSKAELHDIVYGRFRKLGEWVEKKDGLDRQIAEHFLQVGAERAETGIKVSEMAYSLMLERDLIWRYILEEGIITEGIDLNRAIEFSHRLNHFYEKAVYFALVGHENHGVPAPRTQEEGFFESTFEGFRHWLMVE
ncbi:RsbRD N-terminal domain-containing protein [Chlorobium sp. N1]|uniref:RsbRD N-terminal domain-containing protein n=1 Tax=Chlorobium sp. N1 TaxID=2491138 RepID=UPI0010401BB6|nr:RsbRD N-terminal domain-containing protein [Chlorobium sp. N1]TCD47728.1 hypothetical protein E0L29_05465 [Chlorobium sp. N1]